MPNPYETIKRLISPEAAEEGAEDDVIERSPQGVHDRLKAEVQRRRMARKADAKNKSYDKGGIMAGRQEAMQEAERG